MGLLSKGSPLDKEIMDRFAVSAPGSWAPGSYLYPRPPWAQMALARSGGCCPPTLSPVASLGCECAALAATIPPWLLALQPAGQKCQQAADAAPLQFQYGAQFYDTTALDCQMMGGFGGPIEFGGSMGWGPIGWGPMRFGGPIGWSPMGWGPMGFGPGFGMRGNMTV